MQGAIYPGDASALESARDVAYRWIRQGQYKLIVPHGKAPWGNYLKSPSLFNLKLDPSEQTNLIHEPAHKPIVQSLKQQLDAWWNPNH